MIDNQIKHPAKRNTQSHSTKHNKHTHPSIKIHSINPKISVYLVNTISIQLTNLRNTHTIKLTTQTIKCP